MIPKLFTDGTVLIAKKNYKKIFATRYEQNHLSNNRDKEVVFNPAQFFLDYAVKQCRKNIVEQNGRSLGWYSS